MRSTFCALMAAAVGLCLATAPHTARASEPSLQTEDGKTLHAIAEERADAAKGVVLVHMLGRDASDWTYFAARLHRSGFTVIAPDLRGHGSSDGADADLTDADYPLMVKDVQAAIAWLRSKGAKEVTCVGASIGANLCLQAASSDPGVGNVVALSPGLKIKGVTAADALERYGERPALVVASDDDVYSAKSAMILEKKATGQFHFELLEEAGHGTKMMNRDAGLEGLVMSWILGTYKLASGEMVTPRPVTSAEVDDVPTEGQKLDSHK